MHIVSTASFAEKEPTQNFHHTAGPSLTHAQYRVPGRPRSGRGSMLTGCERASERVGKISVKSV